MKIVMFDCCVLALFDVIPIGSRIIDGFIGRNMEKSCNILIFILKTPIRQFIGLVL